MKKYHSINDTDQEYFMMRDAYLKQFMFIAPYERILEAFEEISPLCHVYQALSMQRLIEACNKDEIMPLQRGKLSDSLRSFSKACRTF